MDIDVFVSALRESTAALNRNTTVLESICGMLSKYVGTEPSNPVPTTSPTKTESASAPSRTAFFTAGSSNNATSVQPSQPASKSTPAPTPVVEEQEPDPVAEVEKFIAGLFDETI